jgi:hypothetical protein
MLSTCSQCAATLPEGACPCAQCGTPVAASAAAAHAPTFSTGSDLEGIGGWLILVAIGLALAPLRSIHGIYATLRVLYGSRFEHVFSVHPGLAGLILFEAATNTIFLIALIALNYLFYQKKKSFPSLMITFLVSEVTLILIDQIVTMHFYPRHPATTLISNTVTAAVWIPYYLCSARVKATFVK